MAPGRGRLWGLAVGLGLLGVFLAGILLLPNSSADLSEEDPSTIRSLAVLSLKNLTQDSEQEYFVEGMTEALLNELARQGHFKVISRSSVMRYRDTEKSLPRIAAELNVDAVVEGAVMRVGDRVRITAQLGDARTDRYLWADSYDRPLHDILLLQREVADAISTQIGQTLGLAPEPDSAEKRVMNPAAYDAYVKRRCFWNRRTAEGLRRGLRYFQEAAARDDTFAEAYTGIADSYCRSGSAS